MRPPPLLHEGSAVVLLLVLLLGAASAPLPASAQVSYTSFSDANCTLQIGSVDTDNRTLGACSDGAALYVQADGLAVLELRFRDAQCTDWNLAFRMPTACTPVYREDGSVEAFRKYDVPAARDASAAPPFSSWPPANSFETFQCSNRECTQQCVSYRAVRLGLCEEVDGGIYRAYSTVADKSLLLRLVFSDAACSTLIGGSEVLMQADTGCTLFTGSNEYYRMAEVLDAPLTTAPSLADFPIVELLYDTAGCTSPNGWGNPDRVYLFSDGSCVGGDELLTATSTDRKSVV